MVQSFLPTTFKNSLLRWLLSWTSWQSLVIFFISCITRSSNGMLKQLDLLSLKIIIKKCKSVLSLSEFYFSLVNWFGEPHFSYVREWCIISWHIKALFIFLTIIMGWYTFLSTFLDIPKNYIFPWGLFLRSKLKYIPNQSNTKFTFRPNHHFLMQFRLITAR